MSSLEPLTLLIQSYPEGPRPLWIDECLESVRGLAAQLEWDYRLLGDELFEPLPSWFAQKLVGRGPILSDLGRLLAMKSALVHYDRVVWLDADVLIFNPMAFQLTTKTFGFGRERWVQPKKTSSHGRIMSWKVHRNLCNALCFFERDNPFLDFYIDSCQSIIRRADASHIAPQMIGPKLLTALHSIVDLPYTESIGSASPHLLIDLAEGGGAALDHYQSVIREETQDAGLNLCHSLIGSPTYRGVTLSEEHLLKSMKYLKQK